MNDTGNIKLEQTLIPMTAPLHIKKIFSSKILLKFTTQNGYTTRICSPFRFTYTPFRVAYYLVSQFVSSQNVPCHTVSVLFNVYYGSQAEKKFVHDSCENERQSDRGH